MNRTLAVIMAIVLIPAVLAHAGGDADKIYRKGEALLDQGKNDEAIKTFRRFLKKYPKSTRVSDAMYAIGWAYAGAKRTEDAITAFRDLLKKYPSFKDADLASFKIGKWLYDVGRFKEAIEALESFPQRYQKSSYVADAYYWAAENYFELKEWKKARLNYKLAIEASGDRLLTAYSKYGLGWALAEEGKPNEAVAILQELQREDVPEEIISSANFRSAGILFSRKEYNRAAEFYLLLMDDERYGSRARFSLGECQYYTRRYEEAIRTYAKVPLDSKKLTIDVLNRTGWCHFKLGDYDNAMESFREVNGLVESPADKVKVLVRIADILFNQKKYAEAVGVYAKVLEDEFVEPEKKHVLYWLARTYFTMGEFERAAEIYLKLLGEKEVEENRRKTALYQIAECYFNVGDYESAIRRFDEVIKRLPGSDLARQALYGKAMCLQGMNSIGKANIALRSFVRRHPDDELASKAFLIFANNTYKLSKFEGAADAYRALISAYPEAEEVDEAYYWLGWCFYNLDNMPSASEIWREAMRIRPTSRYRNEILLGMGEALWKQGQHAEAEKIFKELISTDIPKELIQRVNVSYADLLQTKMEYGQAVKRYSEALDGPNVSVRAKARFGIAESLYHARDYGEALDAYAVVMREHEQFVGLAAKARFRTARCLGKLNRWDEAKTMYNKIIKDGGDDAEKAKAILEDLENK